MGLRVLFCTLVVCSAQLKSLVGKISTTTKGSLKPKNDVIKAYEDFLTTVAIQGNDVFGLEHLHVDALVVVIDAHVQAAELRLLLLLLALQLLRVLQPFQVEDVHQVLGASLQGAETHVYIVSLAMIVLEKERRTLSYTVFCQVYFHINMFYLASVLNIFLKSMSDPASSHHGVLAGGALLLDGVFQAFEAHDGGHTL